MKFAAVSQRMIGVALVVVLAGCQGGGGAKPKVAEGAATEAGRSVRLVDRDVEAPEVFQVADMALWDGRPSLGGVWVASPDVKDPERVIMRNAANGKFVIGALFKRERDNPGPSLQISSDAADALGILAGQPAKISVTALRREEGPATAPDAKAPLLGSAETVATENTDPTASAAAAAPAKGAKPAPAGTIATAALPAAKPGAKAPGKLAAAAATQTAPAAMAAPAPAAAAPAAKGGALIQIGIFSVEANAKRAVDALAKAGVSATISTETSKGKTFWSVTARGSADILSKAKAAGFKDAYLLKG